MCARLPILHTLDRRLEHLHDLRWELEENELRYRDLLDAQEHLIVRRNAAGSVTFANRAYLKTFGLELTAAIGKPHIPIVTASEGSEAADTALGLPRRSRFFEETMTAIGPRWIEWEECESVEWDGSSIAIQRTGRDVTDARRAAAELSDARDAAEAASRSKSRFLASMSHEIRTPMNGILGMSGLLMSTQLSAEQTAYLRAIDQSARSLLALIDEILDFSKIEAGRLILVSEPFSIRAVVAEAIGLLAPRAAEKELSLTTFVDHDLPERLTGDAPRIRQIILNLVSNAIKFTDAGSVSIAVRVPADGRLPGGELVIEIAVSDTGIGLSEEEQAILFTEFVQTDTAVRRGFGGTGLGLAISRRLARAMGGDIRVVSEPGRGAVFTATILASAANSSQTLPGLVHGSATPAVSKRHRKGLRVLLAEDNDINALLATRVLEREGCTVVRVQTGRQAADHMAAVLAGDSPAVDLVLMDIFMPELDGVEATRAIAASYALAGRHCERPPIIAVTANAFEEDRQRYLASGMNDYLSKPFEPSALSAILSRWDSYLARRPAA